MKKNAVSLIACAVPGVSLAFYIYVTHKRLIRDLHILDCVPLDKWVGDGWGTYTYLLHVAFQPTWVAMAWSSLLVLAAMSLRDSVIRNSPMHNDEFPSYLFVVFRILFCFILGPLMIFLIKISGYILVPWERP